MACPLPLDLVCGAVGGATASLAGAALSAVAGWVISGATWLVDALGKVITSSTAVTVRAPWFMSHYRVMTTVAAVVAVPMLLLSAVQSVIHQNPALLLRAAFVHLPLAGLLTGVAVQLVQLSLAATDALCTTVTNGTGAALKKTFTSIGSVLSHRLEPMPTFVLTVGAFLIVAGAFVLWLELLVRTAAIYAAVLFLPLALASLIWPAVSHWCRRLVETIAALVLSKFVVVAVLSLAVGAVTSGSGFSTVLAGGALLLLAAFTPFTLLRLVPLVEVGAAMQLEGARQRVRSAVGRTPDSAVSFALRQAREHGLHRETTASPGTPGLPGTGTTIDPGVPGSSSGAGQDGSPGPSGFGGMGGGVAGIAGPGGPNGIPAGAGASLLEGSGAMPGSDDADGSSRQLPLGPMPREWLPPGDMTIPPGTIPPWEGSPESVIAALEASKEPHRIEPDGYGGIIPGVASPLWGGTEPFSRFEPGPKDNWTWEPDSPTHGGRSTGQTTAGGDPAHRASSPRGSPPFLNWPSTAGAAGLANPSEEPDEAAAQHGVTWGSTDLSGGD